MRSWAKRFVGVAMATALALGLAGPPRTALAAEIAASPAFTASQLSAAPTSDWITNGGTLSNDRYSPLAQINRDNVAKLKAKWRSGMVTGAGPGNSGEAQILTWEGTLFVANGANDVFAMDIDTGKVLWSFQGHVDPKAGAPFGKSTRGVAIGDGLVFSAQLDAKLVALDQKTGKVAWSTIVEPWQTGYSITSAPLYYDGMVITGVSGGVMGRRCSIKAYDAKTGKLIWTFYTIPGPNEPGHETWPGGTDAWAFGGAPLWQTPAVDPALGLIYFSTGNTGPVLNGAVRAGDNLYADSIVALDIKTGKYRWHFQQIHHDIWDLDSANPVVLFDATVDGKPRKWLVEVSKTGWAYVLDRVTGKPLIGIVERPVPQDPRQATAKTQPIPIGDPIVPQQIDIVPEGMRLAPGTTELPNRGRLFTPFWTEETVMKPSSQGGASWPPSSYDPKSHWLYVCATDKTSTYTVDLPLQPFADNKAYFGGHMGESQIPAMGVFAALDVTTNRLAWRQQWKEPCYSGSVVTAGGLVFVGRSDGRLTALDTRDGKKLWEFMTDAGVNTTVTTFERKGQQYVVVHAGGSVFGNGKRGDGVWLFSLDGQIGPVAVNDGPKGAVAQYRAATDAAAGGASANAANGETLYRQACVACHGDSGGGGQGGGKSLLAGQSAAAVFSVMTSGRNSMPAFGGSYSDDQRRDIAAYVTEVLQKNGTGK